MTQTQRLLSALKRGPMTKVQILRKIGVLNAGARIGELREAGYRIVTDMVEVRSRYGVSKVARYRLEGKK